MINITKDKNFKVVVNFLDENKLTDDLKVLKEKELFKGKAGEVYNNLDLNNEGLIYVGLTNNDLENLRMSGFNLGKLLNSRKINEVTLNVKQINDGETLQAILEGLIDSQYNFNYYKVDKKEKESKELSFINLKVDEEVINNTYNLMKGVFEARDLVNLAPIDLYPESYANRVLELFKDTKVEVEVLNKEQIEKLNMKGLLAVNKGSIHEPKFIIYRFLNNPKTDKHLTVVGKGVTYDSGGYALKPATSMASMKSDMAGSAAVVGLMKALNDNDIKTNVVGITALTENMIDGSAYKNGDVISTMKGTTIEVINTDAEGRITLADAIYYAATKLETSHIIEISTLTGAAVVALGNHITGITTEDDKLYEEIHKAGLKAGEFNWRMPITKQLKESVKSDIAELKNAVPGGGGMMTAGIFLNHFAEDVPFIHLDIAGPSFGKPYKHLPNGASGIAVKTIYNYIINNQN